jgi:methyltransferase-like protein
LRSDEDGEERLLQANPNLVFIEDNEGSMLFDPVTGEMRALNRTGAFIYRRLDGKHRKNEILDLLLEEYAETDRDRMADDLESFLQEMQEAQVIGEAW